MKADEDYNNPLNAASSRVPIEAWYSAVHAIVPPAAKKDDISDILGDIMEERASELEANQGPATLESVSLEPNEEKPNFVAVYRYLADVLKGKFPPELSSIDCCVVLALIENLKECIEKMDLTKMQDFLSTADVSRKPDDDKHIDLAWPIHEDLIRQVNASNGIHQDNCAFVKEPGFNSTDGKPNRIDEMCAYLEEALNYPKIRKVKQCLNPLDIPVELLAAEQKNLKALMRSKNL